MRGIWQSGWLQLALSLVLVPAILIVVFFYAPFLVKAVGYPFLLIPSTLGIVERATPADVLVLPTSSYSAVFYIAHPGRYVVYADDTFRRHGREGLDVRETALAPGREWLRIEDVETGEIIPARRVRRGIRPYDEIVARGRPMYTFEALHPGRYRAVYLYHPPAYVAILPDHVTGQEHKLVALMGIQVVALLAYPTWRRFRRWRSRRMERRRKREEAERVWEKIRRERRL